MGFATLVAVLHLGMALAAASDLRFATIFSEHAVLQRDRPLPVWGWSEPGAQVVVSFGGQEKSARADPDGRWRVTLDPMAASAEPLDLSVRSQETVTVRNVLVGEVWLASGQSNVVSSPGVPKPAAVRYAWANAPRCNLANSDGLPASPFRSDDWPSVAVTR